MVMKSLSEMIMSVMSHIYLHIQDKQHIHKTVYGIALLPINSCFLLYIWQPFFPFIISRLTKIILLP